MWILGSIVKKTSEMQLFCRTFQGYVFKVFQEMLISGISGTFVQMWSCYGYNIEFLQGVHFMGSKVSYICWYPYLIFKVYSAGARWCALCQCSIGVFWLVPSWCTWLVPTIRECAAAEHILKPGLHLAVGQKFHTGLLPTDTDPVYRLAAQLGVNQD